MLHRESKMKTIQINFFLCLQSFSFSFILVCSGGGGLFPLSTLMAIRLTRKLNLWNQRKINFRGRKMIIIGIKSRWICIFTRQCILQSICYCLFQKRRTKHYKVLMNVMPQGYGCKTQTQAAKIGWIVGFSQNGFLLKSYMWYQKNISKISAISYNFFYLKPSKTDISTFAPISLVSHSASQIGVEEAKILAHGICSYKKIYEWSQ